MQFLAIVLVAAIVFSACYGVDRLFQRLFRSKAQHLSGLAVRVSKRYGLFGVILICLGVASLFAVESQGRIMIYGGVFVLALGAAMAVYYLSSGIFYDNDSFLISAFAKKDRSYRYNQIKQQRLYQITGGSLVVELSMTDGRTVSVQTTMDGAYAFLDAAFAGWCRQRGIAPESCAFHDPDNSLWFPQEDA